MRPSRETIGERTRTHGMTNTHLYAVWSGIKNRCNNPRYKHYDRYGGRGITYCQEWESFESFRDWSLSAGYKEGLSAKEQSLDRIDVDGNYEPINCRWTDIIQQARNRGDTVYVIYNGEKIPARQFSEEHGISNYVYVFRHAKKGDSGESILHTWNLRHNSTDTITVSEACDLYGVTDQTIRDWIKSGRLNAVKDGKVWRIYT